jgi:hypothetical protein
LHFPIHYTVPITGQIFKIKILKENKQAKAIPKAYKKVYTDTTQERDFVEVKNVK